MSATYEPGSVGRSSYGRVFYMNDGWYFDDGSGPCDDVNDVSGFRPLVVLDPAECADPLILATACAAGADALRGTNPGRKLIDADALTWLADQIEAQTRPPKPAEPLGLGAVVEDAEGVLWVRNPDADVHCKWRNRAQQWRNFAAIDAVRVLSEGVTQ